MCVAVPLISLSRRCNPSTVFASGSTTSHRRPSRVLTSTTFRLRASGTGPGSTDTKPNVSTLITSMPRTHQSAQVAGLRLLIGYLQSDAVPTASSITAGTPRSLLHWAAASVTRPGSGSLPAGTAGSSVAMAPPGTPPQSSPPSGYPGEDTLFSVLVNFSRCLVKVVVAAQLCIDKQVIPSEVVGEDNT